MRFIVLLVILFLYPAVAFTQGFSILDKNETTLSKSSDLLQQYFLIFPPYWKKLNNNEFSGLHYRLAKTLYQHAGLEVKFINVPYQRMQFQVSQGNAAFINYGEVEGVNTEDILHVCVPPTKITLKVYYIKNDLEKITTANGFANKQVIIMHGLPLGDFESIKADPSINFMRPRTIESAIKGLQRDRGDYFIVFDNLMINAKEQFFSGNKQQLKSYPLFTLLGYPITTPKTYKGGEKLCAQVLSSYQQLIKVGVIDKKHGILTSDLHKLNSN